MSVTQEGLLVVLRYVCATRPSAERLQFLAVGWEGGGGGVGGGGGGLSAAVAQSLTDGALWMSGDVIVVQLHQQVTE